MKGARKFKRIKVKAQPEPHSSSLSDKEDSFFDSERTARHFQTIIIITIDLGQDA